MLHNLWQVRELVSQANKLAAALEDLSDDNAALRTKAGLPPGAPAGGNGVRQAREVTLAQLRSVNAHLERQVHGGHCMVLGVGARNACVPLPWTIWIGQRYNWPVHSVDSRPGITPCVHTLTQSASCLEVSDLEEERRKLRLELKFRAKYHGR